MKIYVISNYWHFPNEKSSSRYNSVIEMLARENTIELITSTFYHTKKITRTSNYVNENYKINLVNEPAYKKNVSLKRILAHVKFKSNVIKFLSKNDKPDLIYLFIPPTGLAKNIVRFAKKNHIKIVIDIQDLWPESFEMLLPKIIVKSVLLPMKRNAVYAYKKADGVVAVSQDFINAVAKYNINSPKLALYIGIDLPYFDFIRNKFKERNKINNRIKLVYIGMLGTSYDLITVMRAINFLINNKFDYIDFIIIGDGPEQFKFEQYAKKYSLPVCFLGRLDYESMIKKLVNCDIAISPLTPTSKATIINKHADYLAAGLPIINIQTNNEFNYLLDMYKAGFHCNPGDYVELASILKMLTENYELRRITSENSRKLAIEKFDRSTTYLKLNKFIKGV